MPVNPATLTLRAKILGTLIRDARLCADKTVEECAQAIGVTSQTFEAYELGSQAISLPELEGVAFTLDVPLDHFWGGETMSSAGEAPHHPDLPKIIALRHRMVGATLRQARLEANLTLEALAERSQIDMTRLESYELGKERIPLPALEVLCGILGRSVREFYDKNGPVGVWFMQQRALQDFQALPAELQAFVSKPVNRPYLELARRLSDMSVERLRAVAEGLLEITY